MCACTYLYVASGLSLPACPCSLHGGETNMREWANDRRKRVFQVINLMKYSMENVLLCAVLFSQQI